MNIFNRFKQSLVRDIARALQLHKYDITPEGILLPKAKVLIGGVFRHAHCPVGGAFGDWAVSPNLMVTQGLVYVLNSAFAGSAQLNAWYIAPYEGNVSPSASWTAANFDAQATEFTDYTLGTRLPWTVVEVSAASIGNSAAIAAATMTFATGGPFDLYGCGLLSASAKESGSGKLAAATRFDPIRTNMASGDKLAIEYVLSAADAS